MSISLQELVSRFDNLLNPASFLDACPNGLQIEGKKEIGKMAFAVSASLNVIETAISKGADSLFVHHGLFWNKDPYPIVRYKYKRIKALIDNNVSLFAYHLPLDAHDSVGNNWKAAIDLGFQSLEPFGEYDKKKIGVKGKFPEIDREVFKIKLEKFYGCPVNALFGGEKKISSAALISGNAWRKIEEAAAEGVGCFITGCGDEPVTHLSHELGINFFALGHHASEKIGPIAVRDYVSGLGIETFFIDEDNPY